MRQIIATVDMPVVDNTPVSNGQWSDFLARRRNLLLHELNDIERQLRINPTTSELRKAWRDGRVMPAIETRQNE